MISQNLSNLNCGDWWLVTGATVCHDVDDMPEDEDVERNGGTGVRTIPISEMCMRA